MIMGRPNISRTKIEIKNEARPSPELAAKLNELSKNEYGKEQKFVDRKTHNTMGKNEFLKLLMYQIKNQDPLKPMDQKKFAADLAQFSQLEQLSNLNSKFEGKDEDRIDQRKFYGAGLLGKLAYTKGLAIDYSGEGEIEIPLSFSQSVKDVKIQIFDKMEQLTKIIERGELAKGTHSIAWNGVASDGLPAAKGRYHVKIIATNDEGALVNGALRSRGLIKGISFEGGQTVLSLENERGGDLQKVFLHDVESFSIPQGPVSEGRNHRGDSTERQKQ